MPRLTDARALTLLNPWAYAVTDLGKRVENRSWAPPEDLDYLLIHAGKGWDDSAPAWINDEATADGATRSAIVAVARLAHVCDASAARSTVVCNCGGWARPGQYHWILADAPQFWRLGPVACGGKQGLWRPSADVLAAVEQQVAPAAGGAR